jgi:uncharacterized membrane protein
MLLAVVLSNAWKFQNLWSLVFATKIFPGWPAALWGLFFTALTLLVPITPSLTLAVVINIQTYHQYALMHEYPSAPIAFQREAISLESIGRRYQSSRLVHQAREIRAIHLLPGRWTR